MIFTLAIVCTVRASNNRMLPRSLRQLHSLNRRAFPKSPSTFTSTTTTSSSSLSSTPSSLSAQDKETSDLLITGLNGAQDIMVKVVSLREVVQECIIRNDLSQQSATALAEVLVCASMMGAGLKGEETLQINVVGDSPRGIGNIMAITDGELKIRGMVGKPRFSTGNPSEEVVRTRDLLGEGQLQIVRNHPSWKKPTNGIVLLRDTKLTLNLALYLSESEQRTAALLTDIKVTGNLCRYALGVMVERLPGATDENVEKGIANLEVVEKMGLRSYLDMTADERLLQEKNMFRSMEDPLHKILDDCLVSMDTDSLRWDKKPKFRCSCGIDKVWRTLRLLPRDEIESIVEDPQELTIKCEFCGESYSLSKQEIREKILNNV